MSAKDYIEQYGQLLGEVKDIEHELSELCGEPSTEQFDAVQGSSKEIPYQKHSIALHGFVQAPEVVKQRELLAEHYNAKVATLYSQINEIETVMDGLNDSKARRIIRMYCIDGMKWPDIARKIGGDATENSVKQYYHRVKENL